jgi:hypothetical protein
MVAEQSHQMRLETIHSSGAEEWYCPICGRRFMLNWPPDYQKVILNAGDETVSHSGGKGGLSMGPIQINQPRENELPQKIIATIEEILRNFDNPSDE